MSLPAHGKGGARATSLLAAHFALRNTASNSAEKKGSPSESGASEQQNASDFEKSLDWSECWESNPVNMLPKHAYYRYTTLRKF